MEELQSLLQAACCHVLSVPWVQMDGPFPISSPWVLTALAPHPPTTQPGGSLMAPGPLQFAVTFFFPQERNPCPALSMAVLLQSFILKLCLKGE